MSAVPPAMVEDVVVYGAGMLGRQVAHLLLRHLYKKYRLIGFVDDVQQAGIVVIDGIGVIGSLAQAASGEGSRPADVAMVFAIGYSNMPARQAAFLRAQALGYRLPSLVHPAASVEPTAQLGSAVVVLAGAVVDQYVTLGDLCYLHNGAIVGENCVLGCNNYLSAGTTFGGSVIAGQNNFFGINSTVVNDIKIGSGVFVNAGSLVYKNAPDQMRVVEFREQREVRNT